MKIRSLKQMSGDYGLLMPKDEITVSAHYGKDLIAKGYAEEVNDSIVEAEPKKPRLGRPPKTPQSDGK